MFLCLEREGHIQEGMMFNGDLGAGTVSGIFGNLTVYRSLEVKFCLILLLARERDGKRVPAYVHQ